MIAAFTLPVFFGFWVIYTFTPFYFNIFVYGFIGIILLKMTICIKLETDWAKAAAKAIDVTICPKQKNTATSQEENQKT